ncbi:PEP-CTERM sorting domain-containing protein [Colwellia sp. MEBiC06753]
MNEIELNDTFATGQFVGDHDGSISITGVREGGLPNPNDFFRFFGTIGDTITLETFNLGAITIFDSELFLYNPSGTLIGFDDDSGTNSLASRITTTLTETGMFGAAVGGWIDSDAFNYRLDISGLTPSAVPAPASIALISLGLFGLRLRRKI